MSTVLHVQLLGDFRLAYGDTLLTTVRTPRLRSLLAYLLLHQDAPQSRQYLAFLFWPDTSEEQARANLRNLIYFLRRALPADGNYLLVETQTIQWHTQASFTLDIDAFIQLATGVASRLNLQQAIDLYRGDLLPECYDDWIRPERERLREIYTSTLERIIRQLEIERDYTGATTYLQCLLRLNPLQEETYHQLMRLYAANGKRAEALHVYHSCATVLERELGVEPGSEIQASYQRLLNLSESPALEERRSNVPLIGRQDEWGVILSAWRATSQGRVRCVLVKGETGIGKTRLVEEMIDWAERQGIPVASAYCYATESGLAYAPVAAWLRAHPLPSLKEPWIIEVARLLPELLVEHPGLPRPDPITEGWQRLRLFKGLAYAVLHARSSLVLVIEDLQWCDRDTIEWIGYLLQSRAEIAPRMRLLLIGTLRTGETAGDHPLETLLADLRHTNMLAEIDLGPLSEGETAELTRQMIGEGLEPVWGEKLYQETEGNPLFVVETARLIRGSKFEEDEISLHLPSKVQGVIQARLVLLTPATRELAEMAAVVGRQFTFPVLHQAAGREEENVVRSLDELWRRRLVRELGQGAYDFSHDKIRQVVYEQMSTTRRRFCHHKVADALEMLYTNDLEAISAQLAAHYEQAGILEKAVLYYRLAAQAALRLFANQQTIQLLRKCLRLLESEGQFELSSDRFKKLQSQLFELLGDIHGRIGSYEEARQSHQSALAQVDDNNRLWQARLYRKIGNNSRELLNYDQALMAYQCAQESIGQPPLENAEAWWWEWIELQLDQSLAYFYLSRQEDVIRVVERLSTVVEQYGTPPQRGRYYRRLVTIRFLRERFVVDNETIQLSREALATIKESDDLVEIASAHFGLGLALILSGDLDEAEEQILSALKVTETTGQDLLPVCFAYLSIIQRKRGNIKEALEYAHRVMDITTPKKDPSYYAIAIGTVAWAAWHQRQLKDAEQYARQALAIWQESSDAFPFRWVALWPLLASILAQDRLAEAMDAVQALFGPYQQPPPPELSLILMAAIQARDQGQFTDSLLLLNQALELAATSGYL